MALIRRRGIMGQQGGEPLPPNNEVWYWAPEQVTLYSSTGVQSHTFADGKGVLTFASTVTTINTWLRGTAITKCRIPESTTTLTANALDSCSSLTDINLPTPITTIGGRAFYKCSSLVIQDLNLPNLTTVDQNIFNDNGESFEQMPHVLLVSNLGRITSLPGGANAGVFRNQEALIKVVLPSTLTSIGNNSFNGCISLTQINLPESITSIGSKSFKSCSSLVIRDLNLPNLTSIQTDSFDDNGRVFSMIPHILSVSNLGGITSLGAWSVNSGVFRHQEALNSAILPLTLTSIGNNAFRDCLTLITLVCNATTPPTLGSYVFTNTPIASLAADAAIYVPDEAVDDYKAASGWSTYASRIKPLSEKPA